VRYFLIDHLLPMDCSQGAFHSGRQVVAAKGNAKGKQGGLWIAQRVRFATKVRGQLVKYLLNGPAAAIKLCYFDPAYLLGKVRKQVNLVIAITSRRLQLHRDPAHLPLVSRLRVGDESGLLVHASGAASTDIASFPLRGPRHASMLPRDEISLAASD